MHYYEYSNDWPEWIQANLVFRIAKETVMDMETKWKLLLLQAYIAICAQNTKISRKLWFKISKEPEPEVYSYRS